MAWEHLFKFLHEIRHTPSFQFLQSPASPHPSPLSVAWQPFLGTGSGLLLRAADDRPRCEKAAFLRGPASHCALHPLIRPGDEFWRSGLCQSGRLFFLSGSACRQPFKICMHRDGYMSGAVIKTQGTCQPMGSI
ncbi:hypothetical protein B0T18DRAFT_470 [Schizothecium vesticola]|uniref:Uncharacterized protein n=1 Tax=Schizothecium vesticola TaxID=314040 RepID=A0AA40F7W2_9PEZI|nr:hypothetical protein B0T18DRAFT_470 [Schizothecium vesticola]